MGGRGSVTEGAPGSALHCGAGRFRHRFRCGAAPLQWPLPLRGGERSRHRFRYGGHAGHRFRYGG